MRVFLTGHKGQLGQALLALHPNSLGVDLPEVDITNAAALTAAAQAARPDLIMHCAALTDVDGAARNPALAYQINGLGTQNVALAAAALNIPVAYISTNEVFDGTKNTPYTEYEPPRAINPYGQSKLAGEWFISHLLRQFYIIRISWLTAPGGRNFVHRIIQLADDHETLRVVTDEVACPTFVNDLAPAIWRLIATGQFGIYHLTNSGYCSRYAYAQKILELSGRSHLPIEPITLADFPRPSTPPKFAPLANFAAAALGIELRPWEEALQAFFRENQ
jgi:dTDP-4-dehydrorhamnose reductase